MATAVALPTGTLAEITDQLQALFDTLEMIEDPDDKRACEEEIQRYLESEVRKVDGINGYLTTCENQQEWAKQEIGRLRERIGIWESREQRVRDYVQMVMERKGEKKLEGRTATFLLRQSPAAVVITDEEEIPVEFKRTTISVTVDKRALKKAIDDGRDIPGADLSIGKNTLVRK